MTLFFGRKLLRVIIKIPATIIQDADENQTDKAIRTIDKAMKLMPVSRVPFEQQLTDYVDLYYKAGAQSKGDSLANILWKTVSTDAKFYYDLPARFESDVEHESNTTLLAIKNLMILAKKHNRPKLLKQMKIDVVDALGGNPFEKDIENDRQEEGPFLIDPDGYASRLRTSIEEKEAELSRIRRHTEELREQLTRERERTLTQLIPRRFALRGEAQCLPVSVEIRLRGVTA